MIRFLLLCLLLTGCRQWRPMGGPLLTIDGPDTSQKWDSFNGYNFGSGPLQQPAP